MRPSAPSPVRRGHDGRVVLMRLACAVLASGLAAGCGTGGPGQAASPGPVPPRSHAAPSLTPGATRSGPSASAGVRKILVIMEENHDIGQIFPSGMPYLWRLARRYGRAAHWSAIGHPSLPNYLAIFSGSPFSYPQDCSPGPGCTFPAPSVFGQALARGGTARAYEESMPHPCDTASSGNYDVNHNPWAYIPAEAAECRSDDLPAGTPSSGPLASDVRAGSLPTVGLITPNLIDDAHNGTVGQADAWLRAWMPVLTSGPDWRSGRLAIVVVFDEGVAANQVPFVLIAPHVSGAVMSSPANHYALTRLIDDVIGAPPLRRAARAPEIASRLGLTAG